MERVKFFRLLGKVLRDISVEGPRGSALRPTRRGHSAAATSLDELGYIAKAAEEEDWMVALLSALAGGDATMGFVMSEMVKKKSNASRVNPVQSFVAGILDANQVRL